MIILSIALTLYTNLTGSKKMDVLKEDNHFRSINVFNNKEFGI